MSYETILFTQHNGVARLTLNRPDKLNAVNKLMHAELSSALDEVESSGRSRVVVLTGAGRAFCAGQDLSERNMNAEEAPDLGASLEAYYNPFIRRLTSLPLPVIGAVNGVAAGAGANIALACDIVVARRSASFVQSFGKIGLVPDCGGTWMLPRLVGLPRALGLAMLSHPLGATEAQQWGLIWATFPDEFFDREVDDLASKFANAPTRALAAMKAAMRQGLSRTFDAQLDAERDLQRALGLTGDYREGVNAFKERRPASFSGS